MNTRKILIIGKPGIGKTALGKMISRHLDLPLFDEVASMSNLPDKDGVYISNAITPSVAVIGLPRGFVLIQVN